MLYSIEALDKGNIKDTQNKPIMVYASDLNYYYCKYHSHVGAANKLFKEFVVASFQKCWGFHQAPFSLIKVLPEHVPEDLGILRRSFETPCFGLQTIEDAADLTKVNEDILANSHRRDLLKEDALKLAFFDIWTGNEDRHNANYNILFKLINGCYVLIPIDHEACFNHGNFEYGLTAVTYEENLIYTTFFRKLLNPKELRSQERLEKLKESFYICSQCCGQNVDNFLLQIPREWNIDIARKQSELRQYLLNDQWFNNCWNTFLEFLQFFINK